ncbi:MAG TPA: D-2-hydroxyacid dehydrogenase [Gemmatimonadaceae bacterium]
MSSVLVADLRAKAPVWRLSDEGARRLVAAAPEGWSVRIVEAPTISDGDGGTPPSDDAMKAVADAEAYVGFGMSRDLFLAAPRLRWIHSAAAGVGGLLFPELRSSGVIVTNSAGVHAEPIAEHVLGGILHFVRAHDVASELQRRHEWAREPFVGAHSPVRELSEYRALILGAGGIGRAIARKLAALGVACVGVRRRPELGTPAGFTRVVGADAWEALVPESDLLVISAPATPATHRLVTAPVLDRLPHGAIVVNVARGSLLDEAALAERIAGGAIRGAVLDVFEREPLPAESPLWELPSVLLTPHVSAVSPHRFWERELSLVIDNWRRLASGAGLRNVVDVGQGY